MPVHQMQFHRRLIPSSEMGEQELEEGELISVTRPGARAPTRIVTLIVILTSRPPTVAEIKKISEEREAAARVFAEKVRGLSFCGVCVSR